MKARLIILIVVALGLVVFFLVRPQPPTAQEENPAQIDADLPDDQIALLKMPLADRDLPGEEPPEEPELAIQVEVDPSGTKNRLYFYITEAHGYYVETFDLLIWYKDEDTTGPDDSLLVFSHHVNGYLKANETLKDCLEVTSVEREEIGGEMGASEDWEGRVIDYGRARVENPDPLPPLADVRDCD